MAAGQPVQQLSNPVASLISVPLQYNVDFDIGPENGERHTLNVQPVIPHGLNEDRIGVAVVGAGK